MRSFRLSLLLVVLLGCGSPRDDAPDASSDHDATTGRGPELEAGATPVGDGASSSDGGVATCGGAICRDGATCVRGACEQTCTGASVPGDYATLQSAVSALAPTGGTICLAPGDYAEYVRVPLTVAPMHIVGVSAAKTSIQHLELATHGSLRGVTVRQGAVLRLASPADYPGTSLEIVGCRFTYDNAVDTYGNRADVPALLFAREYPRNAATAAAKAPVAIRGTRIDSETTGGGIFLDGPSALDLALDGVDLSARYGTALAIAPYGTPYAPSALVSVALTSSFIHDSAQGLASSAAGPLALQVRNNTFLRVSGTALRVATPQSPVEYFSNLFVENGTAVDMARANVAGAREPENLQAPDVLGHGHDLYFGNTTNFAGAAVLDAADLKVDPLLGAATEGPPPLRPGSPARGAGETRGAPAQDYWARARVGRNDIGAMQDP
ncbi:MAG: hypothetical protein HOO96_14395 [Polyangiaceae bacterium]|nr:hypothetical protein [Polyangiaceae bacterium]